MNSIRLLDRTTRFASVLVLSLAAAWPAASQNVGDLLVSDSSSRTQGVVLRRDALGNVTTWFNGVSGSFPNWITMAGNNTDATLALVEGNQFLLGAHVVVTPAGAVTTIQPYTSSIGFPNGQVRDGDGSTYSAHQSGLITRYDPLLQSFSPVGLAASALNAISLNRDTGRLIGVIFPRSAPYPGSIVQYSPATGAVTTLLAASALITRPSGIAHDPTTGDLIISRFDSPGLLRFDPLRRTFQTLSTAANLNGVVVSTRNTFLVPDTNGIIEFNPDGTVRNTFGFPGRQLTGVVEYGSRRIELSGIGIPNSAQLINVSGRPTDANKSYFLGASLSLRPAVAVFGGEPLNLAADPLLTVSTGGTLPAIFRDFAGVLDANARATAAMVIPGNVPAGLNAPVHIGGIVADPAAPGGVSTVLTSATFTLR